MIMETKSKSEEKIMYAYVVADLLHIGHILALENAKSFCDKLIVGVLTDKATMEKKPQPIMPFNERIKLIGSLKCVDAAVAQETYSPIQNLKKIKPDLLAESTSHSEEDLEETKKVCEIIGCKVIILPYYPEQNSTDIKKKIIKVFQREQERYINKQSLYQKPVEE